MYISALMPKVRYPSEINGKLVRGNVSLIPICSLSNRSLLPSLTVHPTVDLALNFQKKKEKKPLLS